MVGEPEQLSPEQLKSLHEFLTEHHEAFCLEEHERGKTDLVQLKGRRFSRVVGSIQIVQ